VTGAWFLLSSRKLFAGIPAGSPVHVSLGAADHDEKVLARPEDFDITRPPHPHLAFATGPHTCLGLQLARSEMASICNVDLDRLAEIRVLPEFADAHVGGIAYRSPASVPAVWNAAPPVS